MAEIERHADWLALAELALEGLAELGDSSALPALVPLLKSPHPSLRKLAAGALAWVALPHHVETLRQALQHSDPQVKYRSALGLAYAGDPLVGSLVFSPQAGEVLSKEEQLVAAFTLGPAGEDQLAVFLDEPDEGLRNQALLIFMLLELALPQGAPVRCLTCLSARPARVRLTAARALEAFADRTAFRDFVIDLVNDRGDESPWKVSGKTVDSLAELLAGGSPATRARTAHLLRPLVKREATAWEQGWGLHSARYAAEIDALRQAARERAQPAPTYTPAQLQELGFGAYVGLVREQGGSSEGGTDSAVVRVRQTALTRVQALAASPGRQSSARPVLVQALGDPNQAVRLQAFDQLKGLGMDADALGAAALGAGHTDVGVRGLEALAGGGTSEEGQAVLEEALRTRTDDLAVEAAKLLIARRGTVPVAGLALGAAYEPLRRQAVEWLAAEYDKDPAARDFLRQALQSRHRRVSQSAALELALKKDPAAFGALAKHLLDSKEEGRQSELIEALVSLGDSRAADVFLDRLEADTAGTAPADELLPAVGEFRRPETVDRLLALAEKNENWRDEALSAVLAVSGYDQGVPGADAEDESPDEARRRAAKEHPRRDDVLARLLERSAALRHNWFVQGSLIEAARWAPGKEVEAPLATLSVHADSGIRNGALQALGWRLRKRGGSPEPLLKALKARDPAVQFLAAEGLARAGRDEGLSILMSAVEVQPEPALRFRAVQALGELGDARALDLLLKIVNDPLNIAQSAAAEALGHLGRSAKAEEILRLLENLGRGSAHLAESALKGLRWLDHPEGWRLIRRRASDRNWGFQRAAVELLAYHDDEGTRDLLLRLLRETPAEWVWLAALSSARRLWGQESLEPDYSAAQSESAEEEQLEEIFRRLQERGDARRLLEILPKLPGDAAAQVKAILLARRPLPVAEARAVLAGPDPAAAGVAAHLLGRAGAEAGADSGPAVGAALRRWWGEWDKARREEARRGAPAGQFAGSFLEPLRSLIWAAGRLSAGTDELATIATTRADASYDRPLRRAAVMVLAAGRPSKVVLEVLEALAVGGDPEVRELAADAVARADAARGAALAERLLSDRVTFNRVAAREGDRLADTLRKAAGQVHYQGVAVPRLSTSADVAGLSAVAGNRSASEETRLGAVEGLAAMARPEAEAELERLGRAEGEPKELRKAAWRGLRRSRRARKKAIKAE
jgi:ParB family chromosome partitioning protein